MTMPTQKPGRSNQSYGTPPKLLTAIKDRLCIKEFSWDLAADKTNAVADAFFSESPNTDAFNADWHKCDPKGWMWLNPPYGDIKPWVEKARDEAEKGAHIVMLIPASVGSNWWTNHVEPHAYISFLTPRLTFVGCKDPYPKDCALLLYTPWIFIGHEHFFWKNHYDYCLKKEQTT